MRRVRRQRSPESHKIGDMMPPCETCRILTDLLHAAELNARVSREEYENIKADLELHTAEHEPAELVNDSQRA
jgi:hypothetical protein